MKWFLMSFILCYLTGQCFGESDFNDDGDLLQPSQSHVLSMLQNDMERIYATVLPSDIEMATILPAEVPHTPSFELHEIGSLRFKRAEESSADGSGDQTTASTSSATPAEGSGATTVQPVTDFDTTTSATTTLSTDGNATGVGTATPDPNQTTPDTSVTTQESTTPKVESTTVPYSTDTGTTLGTSTPTVHPTDFTSTFAATETQTGSGDDETTTLVTQTTSAIDTSTTDVGTDASTFTTTGVQTESNANETTIPMTQTTGAPGVSTTDVTSSVVGTTPSDTTQFTETSTRVPDTQTGSTPVQTTVLTTQVGSTSVATTTSSVTASTAQVTGSGEFESTTALDTTVTVFEPMTTIDTTAVSTTGVSATDTTVTFSTSDSSTTVATTSVDDTTAVDDTSSIIETIFITATFVNASTPEFRASFSNALEDLLNGDSEGSGSREKRAVGTTSGTVNVTVMDSSNLENLTVRVDYVVCDDNGNLISASEVISNLNSTVNSTEYGAAIGAAIGVNVTDILVFAEPASNTVTPTSTPPLTSAVTADVTPANTTDFTTVDTTSSSNTTDFTTVDTTSSSNTTDFTTVDTTSSSNTTDFTTVDTTSSSNTTDFTTVDTTSSSNTTDVTTIDVTLSTVATTQSTSGAINATSAIPTLAPSSVATSSAAAIATTTSTITNDTYIVVTSFLLTTFTDATSENFRVDLAQVLSSLYNNVTTTSARRKRADGTYNVTVESGANSGTDNLAVEARYSVARAGNRITGREASVVFSSVSDNAYSAALIPKFGDNTILRKSIPAEDLAVFAASATVLNYILTEFTLTSTAVGVTSADLKHALETIYNGIGASLSPTQDFVVEMTSVPTVSGTNAKAQYYVILSNSVPKLLRSLDAILFLGNLNNETYGQQLALQVNVSSVIQKASPVNVGNPRNATEIQSVLQLGNFAVFSRLTNTTETTYNIAITDILRRSYSNVGFNVIVLIYGFYNGTCVECNDLVYVVSIIEDGTFASSAYAAGSAWANVYFINNEFSRNVIPGDVNEIRPNDISTCNDVTTYAYIDLLRNPPSDTQAALAKIELVNGIKSAFAASYPNNNLQVCHVVASGLLTVTMGLANPDSNDLMQPNYCRALLRVYDYPTRFNDATQFDNTSAVGLFITETNQCTATMAVPSCIDPTLFWVIVGLLIFFVVLFVLLVLLFIYCYCLRKANKSYEVNRGRETARQVAPPAPVAERFEVQREPMVQHSAHVAEPVAPVVVVATKSAPKRRKSSKATRESEPALEAEEPRYRPNMSSLIEPTAFMGPSGNSNGVTRFRTTVHPIALPPIQPPPLTERLRRNADELDSPPGPRRRKSRPRVVEDDALQREYEKAQSSLDEILSPRQPTVFDAPKRKRPHKRRGELDLRHPAHDPEIDELLDPPGAYTPMDSSRSTTDRPPEAMRERIHALLDDAFSLVAPRNIVAPVGSTDSGISPSTPLYSNSLDDIGSLSMPQPHGHASNLSTHRDFGLPRNEEPLFTRVVPPLVRTPRTGTEPVSFYTPASATPSGESAYITPVRRVPSPAGNGTVWTPYRAFDEVQRLRGELTNGARPHSAPTSDPMTFTPSLVHGGDDVKLPVTSLPAHTFSDPNSVPDSTAQMVQEVRDELARLAGVRPATGS